MLTNQRSTLIEAKKTSFTTKVMVILCHHCGKKHEDSDALISRRSNGKFSDYRSRISNYGRVSTIEMLERNTFLSTKLNPDHEKYLISTKLNPDHDKY